MFLPAATLAGVDAPCPKNTSKLEVPSPFGVMVTKPVLSCVISNNAEI